MAVFSGPEISNSGLVLHLDASNLKAYDRYENLALNSEALNLWNNNGNAISIATNADIAPDGTLTADVLSQTAVTAASRWISSNNLTYTAGITYTLSIWLKKVSGTDAQPAISLWVNGGLTQSVGTLTTSWVRYSASFTPGTTLSSAFSGLNISWSDQGVANNFTFAAWGFQVEVASQVTDYYPTTSSTKTRGTTWSDMSGSGLVATKTGSKSPGYPELRTVNSGSFNFIGGIINDAYGIFSVPSIPSFSALSVFAWYKTSNTADSKTILRMDNSDFELSINSSNQVYTSAGTNFDDVNVSTNQANATNGNWHNVGLTFDGQTLIQYYDSVQTGTTVRGTATTTAAGVLRIGTRNDAYLQHFVGDISCITLYNRVLTASEVRQNFNALRGRYGV